MKLSELIAAYGDQNVEWQPLDSCMVSAQMKGGIRSHITFGTEQALNPVTGKTDKLAMIVWLDRDIVARLLAEAKARSTS